MDKLSTEIAALKTSLQGVPAADLAAISTIAVNNLKAQLTDPNSAFCQDPQLMLEAAKTLSKMNTDTIEAQRRVIDTLIRYNSQQQNPLPSPADNLLPASEADVDQSSVSNSVFES